MKDKVGRPKEFTDAEAEAYTRCLTQTPRKKTPFEALLEILEKRAEAVAEKWKRVWWKK